MLNFSAVWEKPVPLIDGSSQDLIYTVRNIHSVLAAPGAYVFLREYGGKIYPIYVGETLNIQVRLLQHIERSTKLMNAIKKSGRGEKLFLYCTVTTSSTKKRDKMLGILQKGLVEHALSAGHELVNIQLTKMPVHGVSF